MPIYEYRCEKGHTIEVMQRMSDPSLEECTICGAPVQRVFHPVAVHFKGSGFYNTDYGKQKGKGTKEATASESGSSSDSKDSKGSKDSKPSTDSKPASDKADKKPSKASASSSDS